VPEGSLTPFTPDQLQLGTDEILCCRHRIEEGKPWNREDHIAGRPPLDQSIIEGALELELGDTEATGRVPLRIGIHEQRPSLGDGQRGC